MSLHIIIIGLTVKGSIISLIIELEVTYCGVCACMQLKLINQFRIWL